MARLEVKTHDQIMVIRSQAFCCEFQDVGKNRKALFAFFRAFYSPETGKPLFTYQRLANAFGYRARQNVENFVSEFHASGDDFKKYLSSHNAKHDSCVPLIEAQLLESPFLGLHQHYQAFRETHPEQRLSEKTFRQYVTAIDVVKLLKRVRQLVLKDTQKLDVRRYLQEVLEVEELQHAKKKEIVACFPEVQASSSISKRTDSIEVSGACLQKKLLVVVLYVCCVPQDMLALLCGVGKTSIHNWIYGLCGEELEWRILGEIICWSGQVGFDEKWVTIKGQWYFVLCAVDALSGFPLLIDLYPTLDWQNWTIFFKRFKALYGVPKLITSDGSQSLAIARALVFKGVRYQLCKFHKLKNLMKRLRRHIRHPKLFIRCVRLAKHMFTNDSVSSRKHAAKTLQKLAGPQVSAYIDEHILRCWRKLTRSLTNNASERFNRKIKTCFSGRYGIPSPESAHVLLRGLWLKELMVNGQKHLDATSELTSVDLSRICQEHLDTSKILHFFHDTDPSQIEKCA